MELERRAVRLVEMKADADPGSFSGYGAIFGNEDALGDVIQKGAFKATLKTWKGRGKFPPMLLQHGIGGGFFWGGGAEDLLPVGQWTEMREDDHGLPVKGKLFALNTDKGQYIYEGLRSGVLDGLSIGYKTKQFVAGTRAGEPKRTITEVDLWEVSIVTFPANTEARVTAVKNLSVAELRELEGILGDRGLSRTDRVNAVTAFKRWVLQRDAGAHSGRPRDDVVPEEELDIAVDLLRRISASMMGLIK